MDLTKFILPYPYEAFDHFNRKTNTSFESYKEKIYKWVSMSSHDKEHLIIENINSCFNYIQKTTVNEEIHQWMISHKDKLKFLDDFSGVSFGIVFYEKTESLAIYRPGHVDEEDKPLYPNYDNVEFSKLSIIDRLNWMYENCEFIPYRMMYENIDDNDSHKYSHILRDQYACQKLERFIKGLLSCKPNNNVYYYIRFNPNSKLWYLERDLVKNPRPER